jgi:hypothetical protein
MSEVGYKKPPKDKRYGQPGGNIPGVSAETRRLTIANAEAATRIRARLLSAVEATLGESETEKAMELIEATMLRLLADSEARGMGTPKQSVDLSNEDGTLNPTLDVSKLSLQAMAEIMQAADAAKPSNA